MNGLSYRGLKCGSEKLWVSPGQAHIWMHLFAGRFMRQKWEFCIGLDVLGVQLHPLHVPGPLDSQDRGIQAPVRHGPPSLRTAHRPGRSVAYPYETGKSPIAYASVK